MNHLVIPLYCLRTDIYVTFKEMAECCLATFKKNLQGEWTPLIFQADFSHMPFEEAFATYHKDQFARLYELWKQGNNVLYVDTDTICVKPTEIFGRFDHMVMPWMTDPASAFGFDRYMNGGVIYFPASMKQETWDIGAQGMEECTAWDDSQMTYNKMYWSQPNPYSDQRLNWSPLVGGPYPKEEAQIMHFHGSRDYSVVLSRMRSEAEKS